MSSLWATVVVAIFFPTGSREQDIARSLTKAPGYCSPKHRHRFIELVFDEPVFYNRRMPGRYDDRLTTSHPELEDQAEALLAASSAPEMKQAARRLRTTALSMRRLLTSPLSADAMPALDPSMPDLELRRVELADLAVDVVTAVDYLLNLLDTSTTASPRLVLASEAGSGHRHGPLCNDTLDWLIRKQLDARGAAVRLGMRLISGLLSDVSTSP